MSQQQPTTTTTMPSTSSTSQKRSVSIAQRMTLSFIFTIFGLIFFYLVMVFLSSISVGLTLERFESHGWARSASRFTALTTLPIFILFLFCPGCTRWSLILSVLSACAHFCHFVIISSDLSIYVDNVMNNRIFRSDAHLHPVISLGPLWMSHVVGTMGFIMFLVITTERCFGIGLKERKRALPKCSKWAASWITAVFAMWLSDRTVRVWAVGSYINGRVDHEKEIIMLKDLSYSDRIWPVMCIALLCFATRVMWRRVDSEKEEAIMIGKQKKAN